MAKPGLDKDERARVVSAIRRHFADERGEEIGELAAMLLLDAITEELATVFYNRGLDDAQALLRDRAALLDADLEALKLLEKRPRRPAAEGEAGPGDG